MSSGNSLTAHTGSFQRRENGTQHPRTRLDGLRKRPILPGDALDLRKWNDVSYRSSQVKLLKAVCTSVICVAITSDGIELGGQKLQQHEAEQFAQRDGFTSYLEMARWFHEQHKLPFTGVCIQWTPTAEHCSATGQ